MKLYYTILSFFILLTLIGCQNISTEVATATTPTITSDSTSAITKTRSLMPAINQNLNTLYSDPTKRYDITAISNALQSVNGVSVVAIDSGSSTVIAEIGDNGPLIGVVAKPRPWLTDTSLALDLDTTGLNKVKSDLVPSGDNIRLLYGLNTDAYPNWTEGLAKLIQKAKRNYQINMEPASLNNLKSVSGDDVVLLYTHGCPSSKWVNPKTKDEWELPEFSLSTIDDYQYDSIVPAGFKADYAARRVVLMNIVWDKKPIWGGLLEDVEEAWVYAITPAFVQKYWKINPNGYVSLVACHSGQSCAASMRSAIIAAGASVVSGWTEEVDANFAKKSTFFLFDRLLGANSFTTYKLTPNQRPFPRADVVKALQKKNLLVDPFKGAQFTFFTNGSASTFGMLAPTIKRLHVDDPNNELKITGSFGIDQSKTIVKIKGLERAIKSFSETEIIADLKPDDYGDVQVFVNNHPSNKVQLTMWPLQITWTQVYYGSAYQEMKITAYLRGDVHDARSEIEEKPKADTVSLLLSQSSVTTCKSWGSYQESDETVTFSGTVKVPTIYNGTYGSNAVSVWAYFDPSTPNKLKWYLSAFEKNATTATSSKGGSAKISLEIIPLDDFFSTDDINTDYTSKAKFGTVRVNTELSLNDNYAIQAGSIGPISLGEYVTATLKWESLPVQSPPSKDALR